MGTINPPIPTIGDPNSTEDEDVRTALIEIRDEINGLLNVDNLADDAGLTDGQLASPNNSVYKEIASSTTNIPNGATTGTYLFTEHGAITGVSAAITSYFPRIYLNDDNYLVAGKTTKLRLVTYQLTDNDDPESTFTCGVYPLSAVVAGNISVGTVVTDSTTVHTLTAANQISIDISEDFDIPETTGLYTIGVVISVGTTAASSDHTIGFSLQYRHVNA